MTEGSNVWRIFVTQNSIWAYRITDNFASAEPEIEAVCLRGTKEGRPPYKGRAIQGLPRPGYRFVLCLYSGGDLCTSVVKEERDYQPEDGNIPEQ